MDRIKKIFLILFLLLIVILNSGCLFPDKLPELNKLKVYSPEKFEYGQTTLEKFKKSLEKIPESDIQIYTDGIAIIKLKPSTSDIYSLIRVGFKNNMLDWIEFNLAHNTKIAKFINLYGKPTDIDTKSSKDLDYYNYEFFNISADKNNKNVKSITYFSKDPFIATNEISEKVDIPAKNKKKFFEKFSNIEPGITTESDFSKEYPDLIPYEEDNSETNSIYVLSNELGDARYYYDKAVLKFESGLLTWINLIPRNLPLAECLKIIKKQYKKETVDYVYELYDFSSFVLIVDKKTKMVKSIGLFSNDVKL